MELAGREARLKAEREARELAEREARFKVKREARELAERKEDRKKGQWTTNNGKGQGKIGKGDHREEKRYGRKGKRTENNG